MRLSAFFYGDPGSDLDKACNHIFRNHDGTMIGAGSWLVGEAAGERDVEYEVPDDKVEACQTALKKAGFRLEPTPVTPGE